MAGPIRGDSQPWLGIPITDTPAATTSYSGLGSDLVGRPFVAAYGPEPAGQEAVPGAEPGSFLGALRGQSLKAFPAGPARFPWESAGSTGGNLEDAVASLPAQATMINLDLRRGIAAARGLRQWALRQGEYYLIWAGSWSGERPMSRDTSIRVIRLIPGLGPRQPAIGSQPNQVVSTDEPDRATSWNNLLSPSVVVLSVAAIAQLCWHYARWWKSRKHPERARIAIIPTPSMEWDRLNVSLLIGTLPRAGSHDLETALQKPRPF
jgi:hypothetical protein